GVDRLLAGQVAEASVNHLPVTQVDEPPLGAPDEREHAGFARDRHELDDVRDGQLLDRTLKRHFGWDASRLRKNGERPASVHFFGTGQRRPEWIWQIARARASAASSATRARCRASRERTMARTCGFSAWP